MPGGRFLVNTYYVADSGQQRGPFPVDQLAGQGVRPETMIWSQSMPAWAPARDVQEVAAALAGTWGGGAGAPPATPAPPYGQPYPPPAVGGHPGAMSPAQSQAANNKLAAGICGILLGGFGIHKFVLGMTTPGLIMLLVTVLTCGFGGFVTGIIGIIEGIIYLTKSDEEFYQTYVVQKKQWF
jgi:TM2 domain-containing membrane protein YozV